MGWMDGWDGMDGRLSRSLRLLRAPNGANNHICRLNFNCKSGFTLQTISRRSLPLVGLSTAGRFARLLAPTEYKQPASADTMHTCPNPLTCTFSTTPFKNHWLRGFSLDHFLGTWAVEIGLSWWWWIECNIGFKFCDLCQVKRYFRR